MRRIVVASMRPNAGKTSVIAGIAKNMQQTFTYIKPFGDRMVYRKKRLWDHDAALMTRIFNRDDNPEDLSIGFDHSKLRYMYDGEGVKQKLEEMVALIRSETDLVIIECGRDLQYGSMVHLDPISVASYMKAGIILVLSDDENSIMDDITHFTKNIDLKGANLIGVIINKIKDIQEFRETYLPEITGMGVPVLGIIPARTELTRLSMKYLANQIFAKVIAGESGLNNTIKNIFVGAMSVNLAQRNPLFRKKDKLIITSGDRSDMILAALESDSAGIILTNNILPNSTITSKASVKDIPLMVVPQDTFTIAQQIDNIERWISVDDDKLDILTQMINDFIDIKTLLEG